MRWGAIVVLLLLLLAVPAAAQQAGPVGEPSGTWREQYHWVPLDIGGQHYLLYGQVCRPPGEAPARVVVMAHGSPWNTPSRFGMKTVACGNEAAQWFLQRGYMVFSAMRRGYGLTGGADGEDIGPCDRVRFYEAGLETARDIAAIVDYAASLPYARPRGVILVGHSAGGWGAMAYDSIPHPRVTAIVSMAGGRGGHQQDLPNRNCRPDFLAETAGRYARTATTPMLWIYAANDSFFSPQIAAAMYAAFSQNGGRAEFDQLASFGNDGHQLFFARGGSAIWGPLVERYLASRPNQ
jgi:pimeloyl-ACP methyl ester carboxylesterase